VLSVTVSVLMGIRADQTARRRGIMLGSVGLTVAGYGLMVAAPSTPSFVLAHALILPLGGAIWGQVFATARQAASQHDPATRDSIMATIRALFALPFVVVLPLWSLAIIAGAQVQMIYPVALLLALGMLALAWRDWPRDGQTAWQDAKSGLSLRAAFAELAHPQILMRLLALGAVSAQMTVYLVIAGLIFGTTPGRGAADTALYVGLVAGLEVPIMLALPRLTMGISRALLILCGAVLYALHVAMLPWLAASALVWLLVVPAAIGGALILIFPMAYLQDLMAHRPGTGASLMALQRVIGEVMAALCFVLGTSIAGYGLVAALAVIVAVAGAVWLWWADHRATTAG
jgi:MFS transporter, SET family, sugar efflux transporter